MGRRKKTAMTDNEITALIASRKASGLNAEGGDLSATRQEILNQYLGNPYGDERSGLSKIVTRDIFETVEWAMPSLMKIFAGDDLIVAFEPTGPEDEDQAKQETEYTNYVFKKKNEGFLVLHDFTKDALLSPTAYAKAWYEDVKEVTTERYDGLLARDLARLDEDDELEAVSQEETILSALMPDPMTGELVATPYSLYNVVYKRTCTVGKFLVKSIPPEELVIDEKVTGLDLSEADFICHTTRVTKSHLLDMGFSESVVNDLKSADASENEETENRKGYDDEEDENDTESDLLELEETYIMLDADGSGRLERRKIFSVGETILENEPDDYIPFVAQSAIKIPHRHTGIAWAEMIMDLQRIKTTLTRQMLNNLYRVNNPRPIVGLGVNMQDLLNDAPNAPIRARNINDIRMEPTMPVINQVLPTLQHFNDVQSSRSGVSAFTRGADANTLAESTRGAFMGALEQSNQRLEMLARMFAETGIKQLFLKLHELLLRHQRGVAQFKLRGEWVQVNPSEWRSRRNMSVVVGIGYGTKEQQLMALQQLEMAQEKLAMNGSPIVQLDNIYNLQAKKAELAGTGDPERFFTDPAKLSPEQLQPPGQEGDPLAEAQKMLAQVEQEKNQLTHQREIMAMENKIQELQYKLMVDSKKLEQKDREIENDEVKVILDSEYKEATLEQKDRAQLNQRQQTAFQNDEGEMNE